MVLLCPAARSGCHIVTEEKKLLITAQQQPHSWTSNISCCDLVSMSLMACNHMIFYYCAYILWERQRKGGPFYALHIPQTSTFLMLRSCCNTATSFFFFKMESFAIHQRETHRQPGQISESAISGEKSLGDNPSV